MKREDIARDLLAACSARLHTDAGPQGTAFFVAPGFAVTAAHVIGGAYGLPVQLIEGPLSWRGHVADVRPPLASETATTSPYPAPGVALIKVDEGPDHACALLARQLPDTGARVMAYGYTHTFNELSVTAETELFRLTGMLETPDPGYPLLKLGLGEVTRGMSGAPVLELRTGDVIGMLRTSRKLGSNLGGWVVPADLIRQLWPEEVSKGNDLFHEQDLRWRRAASQLRTRMSTKDSALAESSPSIGTIQGDAITIITGANIGSVHIESERKGLSGDDRGD